MRNRIFATILMFLAASICTAAQQPKALLLSANGEGTLKVGQEEFKVTAVIAKLKDDGTAELTIVTDITVFVSGTWADGGEAQKTISLEISGGATRSGMEGNGKLLLRDDRKSLSSLNLQLMNKSTKRHIEVSFVAK